MKALILILTLIFSYSVSFCQTIKEPESKTITVKKVVKIGTKFYIEESQTTTNYVELTTEKLLVVENDDKELESDEQEKKRISDENLRRKNERIERNKLLKDAIKKGFEPEVKTIEEKERVEKIKAKIEKIK